MVLRLAEVMGLTSGEQNGLLAAAGFVPQPAVLPLTAEDVALSDIRIELKFPADSEAEVVLTGLAPRPEGQEDR
jgi:hypothetical protein